jgi:glycosyltransferase involved in cell wall biosynthesis
MSVTRPFSAAFFRDGIVRALRESTRIHAISQATADVIALHFPEVSGRVRVIPHGIDARYRPPEDREKVRAAVLERIGLQSDDVYFLVVGQNAPYKNHADILRAFSGAKLGPGVKLVLLQRLNQRGRFGWSTTSALYPLSVQLGIQDQVVWLSQISDAEILQLLQSACGLIQYSLCEGFGMPALEAAACGTPVIASDIAPLVEVLGPEGLCVSLEPAALSKALQRVAREPALRQELSEAGVSRSRDFCWDRCAGAHLELYREAAEAGPLR